MSLQQGCSHTTQPHPSRHNVMLISRDGQATGLWFWRPVAFGEQSSE